MADYGHELECQYFLVRNLPLQPPAALAKAAATLDPLGGGRFVAGLGAGGFRDAAQAMGAPARTPGQSLQALEEAIVILRVVEHHRGGAVPRSSLRARRRAPGTKAGAPNQHLAPCRTAARTRAHLIKPSAPDVLRKFIRDVAPDVRERVAAARAQAEPVAAAAAKSSW
jgi:alkanesulfonate monooxygenase SsuD/methylene tetrahydromethanopterin reductase-like flavin-dependent oxidoreductase (luciferase family)